MSAVTVAAAVFVAVGVGIELVFLPEASASSTTTATTTTSTVYSCSGCGTPSSTVKAAVAGWVADFNNRDVTGIANFYGQDALVTVRGGKETGAGLDGVYNGLENIRIFYGSSIGKTTFLNVSVSNYNENDIDPSNANVTFTLSMVGESSVVGALNITIDANQQWNYVGGQWQIEKEIWSFMTFNEQFPVSTTTFPQWTALKEGQNPDLVSEKSFEWHAGPYLAASAYAFLFGVIALLALRSRSSPKPLTERAAALGNAPRIRLPQSIPRVRRAR